MKTLGDAPAFPQLTSRPVRKLPALKRYRFRSACFTPLSVRNGCRLTYNTDRKIVCLVDSELKYNCSRICNVPSLSLIMRVIITQ